MSPRTAQRSPSGPMPGATTAASPADDKAAEIPEEAWCVPDSSGLRYVYEGGQVIDKGARRPLAYEPGIFGPDRLVLPDQRRGPTDDPGRDPRRPTPAGGPR